MKRMYKNLCYLFCLILLGSCNQEPTLPSTGKVMAYRPIYVSYDDLQKVGIEAARKLKNPAKIYVRGDFLFVNEFNEGIHVINNANPKAPTPIAFVKIPGNQDIEIKDNVMYADNGLDLIAIDLSTPQSVKILKRIADVFPYPSYPPFQNVKFECPDPTKGYVINWEMVEIDSPKCFR